MGAMSFEVPDGASVQIIVGKAAPLALSDDTGRPREPTRKAGFWRTTLKGLYSLVATRLASIRVERTGRPGLEPRRRR